MVYGAELAEAVLDDLSRNGVIATWSRHAKLVPGQDSRRVIDVYEITFGPEADHEDRQVFEAFLLRYGRTGHGHEVEIRVLRPQGAPGTFHS